MADKTKVFCIGFQKTGTTSMGAALEMLGYHVTGGNWARDPEVARVALQRALAPVPLYDAFQDNPWPLLYKEMDMAFPGSKFIMTIRPPEQWLKSAVKGFGTGTSPVREWIYGEGKGRPVGNEQIWLDRYEHHNREVLDYFANRPDDFIIMDLAAGDGWEKLCDFLGAPVLAQLRLAGESRRNALADGGGHRGDRLQGVDREREHAAQALGVAETLVEDQQRERQGGEEG